MVKLPWRYGEIEILTPPEVLRVSRFFKWLFWNVVRFFIWPWDKDLNRKGTD